MRINRDQGLTLAIIVGLVSVAVFGMWLPKHMKDGELRERGQLAEQELVESQEVISQRESLQEAVARLEAQAKSVRRYVPETGELASLLRQLAQRLERHRVLDQSIQTKPVLAGVNFEVIPLGLSFRGEPESVYAVLGEIESMRRLVRITRMRIEGSWEKDEATGQITPMLHVTMDLCTFSTPMANETGEELHG